MALDETAFRTGYPAPFKALAKSRSNAATSPTRRLYSTGSFDSLKMGPCASRSPAKAPSDAQALMISASDIRTVAVVDIASRDTLYRFNPAQTDSLKSAIKASFVSGNLQVTPAPWPMALVMAGDGVDFVALHYGNVLRVNANAPGPRSSPTARAMSLRRASPIWYWTGRLHHGCMA
jgi:hypothetical protein